MMKSKIKILLCILMPMLYIFPSSGQVVTKEEATVIAQNWISLVIDRYGSWGGHEMANIMPLKTVEKDGRKIGYFCHVIPDGFIVVSIRKELAPVKLYSEMNSYFSEMDDCLPDFIFEYPSAVIKAIESEIGPIDSVSPEELKGILEIDYSESWQEVYSYLQGSATRVQTESSGEKGYQEGDFLLTSNWRQGEPYNAWCPDLSCSGNGGRALVGCVATAGSQILNYWKWPPKGVGAPYSDYYDWKNIVDTLTANSAEGEIAAVAALNAEVGEALDMDYGCNESGAY
nr:C10 family peptidase [Bacteroidota bacterium]